ncbi:tRNA-dihydrouridine synthase 1 [Marchantia polymorpha subsp. ruderalis]|uniref:tRNA-dihydrouridine(16/17) synthase [NAD(P)(+)] n=2 Tax=Marchantia polymorpha TaxID=3197 RepID=A0A176WED4_MARPO|nr:hypothetical protein AXG93_3415s1300 [Marchantia polymorpha subsp. ruderalis]PTQ30368.1 hypothetical protein MARPO_0125s0018 [Marchantia polymorpha]BBN07834.1 hypothetical protein Mp_4g06730 [Marchantia polymorpha subsp. ruderalis]|eukprot:PTQ30368.1 hypothetical protein MARPO_0125s0018 [Marchantia polymorpha]
MRVPSRRLQPVIVFLRSVFGSRTEVARARLAAGGLEESPQSLAGVKGVPVLASAGGFTYRDDWRFMSFSSNFSTMQVAMPPAEGLPEERLQRNGAMVDAADVIDNRVGENGADAGGAALMVLEGEEFDGAVPVPANAEFHENFHVRANVGIDPPAELAEMVMVDGNLDESAPTTPDNAAERVDLNGSCSRNFELKFSGGCGSAAKRMRMESPTRAELEDVKEKHIAAAWEHWRRLGSPKLHVAPMVDQSELPFRMLCRKYGATAAYTPMLHSRLYVQDLKYRKEFTTCPEDRPLFVQFCANNPATLLDAGRLVESQCDYVDINLGCPQRIAKRGNYGAFLMDQLPLVQSLVSNLSSNLTTPVSCKIRLFPDIKDTLAYAHMLEDAGCSLLAVHGRTRDQKNGKLVRADWEAIKTVREALRIPVLANGNIRWLEDVDTCIAATGVEGVMSAESLLENPALFAGYRTSSTELNVGTAPSSEVDEDAEDSRAQTSFKTIDERLLCLEYLDLCEQYPVPMRMVRGHVHKMLGNFWFKQHPDLREELNRQYKLNLDWLKDMVQRMLARPTPGAVSAVEVVPASAPVVESQEIENAASTAVHNLEPLAVDNVAGGTAGVSEISPVDVNTLETVSVQ